MLEGRPIRDLIRQNRYTWSAQSEGADILRHNGSNSVPGLVRIICSRTTFSARVAARLKKSPSLYARLTVRTKKWITQAEVDAQYREMDREWAVTYCGSLNEQAAAAHPVLLRACKDPNPRVRFEAVRSLLRTEVPPEKALAALTDRMLHDSASEVRSSAAMYIGLLHETAEPAIPALRQATNDTGLWVSSKAREALEKIETAVAEKSRKPAQ